MTSPDPWLLWAAAMAGDCKRIKTALALGCDVNTQQDDYKKTALMMAAWHGHLDAVELLLQSGADPKIKDKNGENALAIAQWTLEHTEDDLPFKKSVPVYRAIVKLLRQVTG